MNWPHENSLIWEQKKIIPFNPHQSSSYIAPGESGMVLAVILVLLGIIVALVLQAQVVARLCLNAEKSKLLRTQLREAAGDAAWHALGVLAADQNLRVDHIKEEWAVSNRITLPNGIDTEIVVIDENRFVDVNMLAVVLPSESKRLPGDIVRDLLAAEDYPNPELLTRIIQDWLDKNQDGPYEAAYYRRLPYPVAVADALIESNEEMLWLLGAITNSAHAATSVTARPGQGASIAPLNVNTAGRPALLAVLGGNNAALVERIIRLRDAMALLSLNQVLDSMSMQRYGAYLSVNSSYFSVYASARMGVLAEEVYCLARRDHAGNVEVLRWIER